MGEGLSFSCRNNRVFSLCPEFGASFFVVLDMEDFRNGDLHRAALRTVMTCGAGDGLIGIQGSLCRFDHFLFVRAERLEVFHEAEVVLHLFQRTHAAEYGKQVILAGDIAEGP